MKKILVLILGLLLPAYAIGSDVANDIILTQRKSDNSGSIQRNVAPGANQLLGFNGSKVPISLSQAPDAAQLTGLINSPTGYTAGTTEPVTITSHAGTLDMTYAVHTVTDSANCTLTVSADTGTLGTSEKIVFTNSDTTAHTVMVNNTSASPIDSFVVPAGQKLTRWETSTGTAWEPASGAPNIASLGAAPAGAAYVHEVANSATGVSYQLTDYAATLGTFASPDTTAGAITWASPVLEVYTSASAALRTYTLPAASAYKGQAVMIYVAVGTNHVNVQPASGARLVLAGTLLTADHYAQAATSAPGNYICFISDGTNWISIGYSGTWADAASA